MAEDLFLDTKDIFASRELVGPYKFALEGMMVKSSIHIYREIGRTNFSYIQIYRTKTPDELYGYRTSVVFAASEFEAFACALNTFTDFYRAVMRNGHMPNVTWLVANDNLVNTRTLQ